MSSQKNFPPIGHDLNVVPAHIAEIRAWLDSNQLNGAAHRPPEYVAIPQEPEQPEPSQERRNLPDAAWQVGRYAVARRVTF